jgi:multidrug resistance efflux pump
MPQEKSTTILDQPEVAEPRQPDLVERENASDERKKAPKRILALAGALALIIATSLWWWHARQYEETDDAQVDGHIYPISARISGHLAAVHVEEGQFVKAGTVLVEVDPKDYEVAAERAKAEYEDALAEATAANLHVPVSRVGSSSQISGAEAELERAQAGVTVALKQVEQANAKLIDARAVAATANAVAEGLHSSSVEGALCWHATGFALIPATVLPPWTIESKTGVLRVALWKPRPKSSGTGSHLSNLAPT